MNLLAKIPFIATKGSTELITQNAISKSEAKNTSDIDWKAGIPGDIHEAIASNEASDLKGV